MSPSVSVVIPTYNYGRFIGEALESALGQTLRPLDIVVVDDGSTDNTAAIVSKFSDHVRYIRQENAGVCVARNRGVKESKGDLIAFFDADDTWEPRKLELQAEKFAQDSKIGLVHCGMREFESETGKTISMHMDGLEGHVADELLLWEESVIVGPGGTIAVSRNAFEDVGGFDETMRVGEDWDFCYRVARRYKVGFVREPLVNYRNHTAAAHLNVSEMERGMSLFYSKAFAEDGEVLKLKNRAMGNFHRILAGSYFHNGDYGQFLRHAVKSLVNRPSNLRYFLEYPRRRWRRI